MNAGRKNLFLMFVALAIASAAFLAFLALQGPKARPVVATILPEALPLPEFSLLDQDGESFNRASFAGQWSVVFFGFTHCPDICPATLQQLALARAEVIESPGQEFPQIILISVDPERDTPPVLREYIAHFGPGISGVTGEIDELRKLTSALGIYFEKSALQGDDYGVDHSAVVLLIDPQSGFRALFSAPHRVEDFVTDIPLITGTDQF
jgi:protein SCO1/2